MKYYLLIAVVFLYSCKPKYDAQVIVDKSIENTGLYKVRNAKISFNFRNKKYTANRNNGVFTLTRSFYKDSIFLEDELTNSGFQRKTNGTVISLSDKEINQLSNAVNSVHYFSILPYGLNDPAVKKELLGTVVIKGKSYYKIKVTFAKEGGGDDHDDVFLYWFAEDTFKLEYLAYQYHTNGGGIRFRDVKKEHINNGIRLVDYNNYKPKNNDVDFLSIDRLYEDEKLVKLSEIILTDIKIVE
ncbi:DUF6503 family protein [Tenacibaculum sp. SG-28]|uniref:DUF6503 family protein n=1 Tax=Tenacibaculum sp. SG-28 TaxID=754426 RepID=UPI000CF4F7E7|nr:DUF6503 family protein [Tenacibaculum sp. SG-28]PQJ23409.1 hypothetical protein BSU00_04275 [Tenacibaculum sp. SG-28]